MLEEVDMRPEGFSFPHSPWPLAVLVVTLWWGHLALGRAYYQRAYEAGYFPPEADSITIPIMGGAVGTVVLFPVVALGLWLVLRRYPRHCRLTAWDSHRPIRSLLWTLLAARLVWGEITTAVDCIQLRLPLHVASSMAWLLCWLWLRSVVASPRRRAAQHAAVADGV